MTNACPSDQGTGGISLHSLCKTRTPSFAVDETRWKNYSGKLPFDCDGKVVEIISIRNSNTIVVSTLFRFAGKFFPSLSFHQIVTSGGKSSSVLVYACPFSSIFASQSKNSTHPSLRPLVFYHPTLLAENLRVGNTVSVRNSLYWLKNELQVVNPNMPQKEVHRLPLEYVNT